MKGDVGCLRFEFTTSEAVKMTWITGKYYLADVLTKNNSPLSGARQLTLFTGKLPLDLRDAAEPMI